MEKHPLLKLWNYAEKWKRLAVRGSIYSGLNKFFDIAPEILIGVAVDLVVRREESFLANIGIEKVEYQLTTLGVLTALIWLLESLFEYLYKLDWRNLAQGIQHELRMEVFEKVLHLNMNFFVKSKSGELISILNDDVNQLERFLDNGINEIIQLTVSTILVLSIFVLISPQVAILAILPIPFIFLGAQLFKRKIAERYSEVRLFAGNISAKMNAVLQGVTTVKSYATEDRETLAMEKLSEAYQASNSKAIKLSSAFIPAIRVSILIGFLFTLIIGGLQTLNDELSVASYSILVFLSQRLLWPFTRLGETIDLYFRGIASANRIFGLIQKDKSHFEPEESESLRRELVRIEQKISFNKLSFSYDGRTKVLDNCQLSLEKNQFVGIVGATGCGKSTLVKLLLGFYQNYQGSILIDSKDVKTVGLKDLRRSISYVSQDTFIFDGTIAENISYGLSIDSTKVWEVLDQVDLKDFVENLPNRLNTHLGERGQEISGGQKQRICIARALYKGTNLVILDEATSAVDNETELKLQKSILNISRSKTIVSIAHRLCSIRHADKIFVIDKGRVTEEGTHEELLALEGKYFDLWCLQIGILPSSGESIDQYQLG